jgi:hypothetical protein
MFAFFLWKQFKILIDKNISFKKIVYPLFVTQDSGYKHHLMKKWTKHAYQKSYIRTSNESVCIHIRPTIPMTHDCLNLPNNHVTAAHLPPSLVFLTTQGQSLVNHVFFSLAWEDQLVLELLQKEAGTDALFTPRWDHGRVLEIHISIY